MSLIDGHLLLIETEAPLEQHKPTRQVMRVLASHSAPYMASAGARIHRVARSTEYWTRQDT